MMTNMHDPQAQHNFYDVKGNAMKPAKVQDCKRYLNKSNCIVNTPLADRPRNGQRS
jgi:hypothetical protein